MLNPDFLKAVDVFNQGYKPETFKVVSNKPQEIFLLPNIDKEAKSQYSFVIVERADNLNDVTLTAEFGKVKFEGNIANVNGSVTRSDIEIKKELKVIKRIDLKIVLIDIVNLKFYSLTKKAYQYLLFLKELKDRDDREGNQLLPKFQEAWAKQLKTE
jgi:hypothetical protein